ncbi:hypothetical protein [Actinacidiphila epipremni]|uniref:Secreted protein n=1 Tax=Actinacidiphila epipremni TaxID=2053013 RepID=A0ABX0ZKG4_9ACTN|nr:hypothetical protein [Actinacidiphila epipremni]NJP42699.1 hypothetical protein [Actinacidiphila epipremni]
MPSLRTALALTLTAAAATLLPAAAATAATPDHTTGADLASSAPDTADTGGTAPQAAAASPLDALPLDALPTSTVTGALAPGIAPVRNLTLDPLSNTGVDPLDNGLGSQVADFKPLSTTTVTDEITRGGSLGTLPLVGPLTGLLPH